jgi:hypothetical protein
MNISTPATGTAVVRAQKDMIGPLPDSSSAANETNVAMATIRPTESFVPFRERHEELLSVSFTG